MSPLPVGLQWAIWLGTRKHCLHASQTGLLLPQQPSPQDCLRLQPRGSSHAGWQHPHLWVCWAGPAGTCPWGLLLSGRTQGITISLGTTSCQISQAQELGSSEVCWYILWQLPHLCAVWRWSGVYMGTEQLWTARNKRHYLPLSACEVTSQLDWEREPCPIVHWCDDHRGAASHGAVQQGGCVCDGAQGVWQARIGRDQLWRALHTHATHNTEECCFSIGWRFMFICCVWFWGGVQLGDGHKSPAGNGTRGGPVAARAGEREETGGEESCVCVSWRTAHSHASLASYWTVALLYFPPLYILLWIILKRLHTLNCHISVQWWRTSE